jgi:hypothetical protein
VSDAHYEQRSSERIPPPKMDAVMSILQQEGAKPGCCSMKLDTSRIKPETRMILRDFNSSWTERV